MTSPPGLFAHGGPTSIVMEVPSAPGRLKPLVHTGSPSPGGDPIAMLISVTVASAIETRDDVPKVHASWEVPHTMPALVSRTVGRDALGGGLHTRIEAGRHSRPWSPSRLPHTFSLMYAFRIAQRHTPPTLYTTITLPATQSTRVKHHRRSGMGVKGGAYLAAMPGIHGAAGLVSPLSELAVTLVTATLSIPTPIAA